MGTQPRLTGEDHMSRSKPYLAGDQEYLEYIRRPDWLDGELNPNDDAEYSEFQKPYAQGDNMEDSYPAWEWTWPPITFPPIDPVTYIDPVDPDDPCNITEGCTWAKIMGVNEIECGECRSYTQIHVWLSCGYPPWEAAFGNWWIDGGAGGCFVTHNGVFATVCCDGDAPEQTFTLCYNAGNCTDCIEVVVECGCCDEFTLTGNDTVNAGSTWTGTIDPACPGATCEVVSNSGCTIGCSVNESGSQVTVPVGGADCGGFTVTVTEPEGCEGDSASKSVRINGGSYNNKGFCTAVPEFATGQSEDFNAGCFANDQWEGYVQYTELIRLAWNSSSTSNWANHCREWNQGGGDACIPPGGSCPGPGDQSCATGTDTAYWVWEWDCSC